MIVELELTFKCYHWVFETWSRQTEHWVRVHLQPFQGLYPEPKFRCKDSILNSIICRTVIIILKKNFSFYLDLYRYLFHCNTAAKTHSHAARCLRLKCLVNFFGHFYYCSKNIFEISDQIKPKLVIIDFRGQMKLFFNS